MKWARDPRVLLCIIVALVFTIWLCSKLITNAKRRTTTTGGPAAADHGAVPFYRLDGQRKLVAFLP
jgi:hypothetical protein